MSVWLLVFAGGGLGAAARHGVNLAAVRALGIGFPWGTLIVNVVGSVAMGLIAGWLAFRTEAGWTQHTRLLLTTGFLGGFTTFSAFSLDAALLWERGAIGHAGAYVVANVVLSIGGLFGGLWLVRSLS
ncbi:MAG: fluoride efflux transporter CrcB [Hyphomicrobiales bacterium]|nr:fluoride efflux transporter CrcB [Hyphomicrobiales bacterium]